MDGDRRQLSADYVIVGGGIAGVSALEMLSTLAPNQTVILVTASPIVKAVTNVTRITELLSSFDVSEKSVDDLRLAYPNIRVVQDTVTDILPDARRIRTRDGTLIDYRKLALCHGARPKVIAEGHPRVIGIRDTQSVNDLRALLSDSRRVIIVGNGGIATELVYALRSVDVTWVVKDDSIATAFVDAGAGEFFLKSRRSTRGICERSSVITTRTKYGLSEESSHAHPPGTGGSAIGPDWHEQFIVAFGDESDKKLNIIFNAGVTRVLPSTSSKVALELDSGEVIRGDLVISATGVIPNGDLIAPHLFRRSQDSGALLVNDALETNVTDVYAAGDVCQPENWSVDKDERRHWFQMRLWTQARQMGLFVAQSMRESLTVSRRIELDFSFEMFCHVTKFFGYKVVLLGLFNGQGLGGDYEALVRVTPAEEYVKVVMQRGRMQGAVLIGDTDLEETFENLILNQMDLTELGEGLLDPGVDIADYFD